MKKTWIAAACILGLLSWSQTSKAEDLFFVGLEVPMSYTFKTADDGGKFTQEKAPTGGILTLNFPVLGAFALESYEVPLKDQGSHSLSYQMLDYIYFLSLPFLDIGVGVGGGTAAVKGTYEKSYESATATQYLLKLGIPIGAFKILGGYQVLTANPKYTAGGTYIEASGTMISLGAALAF